MPSKHSQYREMDDSSLVKALGETKEELFNLRFQHVTGQLDNHARIADVRRNVARINTELRVREIAAAEELDSQRKDA